MYHRLNLLHIRIPSLREYPDDLPDLVERILDKLKKRYRQDHFSIPYKCIANIKAYSWPGNVRELIHEMERSLIFADSEHLTFEHLVQGGKAQPQYQQTVSLLNPAFSIPESGYDFEEDLKKLSKTVIEEALRLENGNVSAAARRLGVPRDFIRYRMDS